MVTKNIGMVYSGMGPDYRFVFYKPWIHHRLCCDQGPYLRATDLLTSISKYQ